MKFLGTLNKQTIRQPINTAGICLVLATGAYFLANDWLGFVGAIVLWAGWQFLPNIGGPPVLQMAFTHQWAQVFLGIYYYGLTGRKLEAVELSDYRPMVMIGTGCLLALLVGLVVGAKLTGRFFKAEVSHLMEFLPLRVLVIAYVISFFLVSGVTAAAWEIPSLTQAIISLTFLRLAILFLLLRKLSWPHIQVTWISVILLAEVAVGITGFFAGFREPLVIAAVVMLERFETKNLRHWLVAGGLGAAAIMLAILWTAVKIDYRAKYVSDQAFAGSTEAKLNYIVDALNKFASGEGGEIAEQIDTLVGRIWVIYYPALAVSRVPAELPHTDGEILRGAVMHVLTPRFLFPEKEGLRSDSEMVRKYSGIWVAGGDDGTDETNDTSIAFGYAAESYIDFGLPWMFVPVLVWGLAMGAVYQLFFKLIAHRELAIAVGTVIFWLCLYIFERSWVKTLGQSVTILVYLTAVTFLVDRFVMTQKTSGAIPERRGIVPG
ncbi:MAG: hypothetical protein JST85_23920 [Acidobacteria bacterium]|nr:hypothetical protein [Acidobacteriota bacterium]